MSEFKIDKDIPIPYRGVYPFEIMDVGDSFFSNNQSVVSSSYGYGKYNGIKFTTKKEGDGYRVWRTE